MATHARWTEAQRYERGFWEGLAQRIETGARGQLDWYGWKARELEKHVFRWIGEGDRAKAKVLEIGSGPIGIVSGLDWGERFAVDPLEGFYKNRDSLVALRNPSVKFVEGVGEDLPFDDGMFSLAIVDNVIDHTRSPSRILEEVHRVLKPGGYMYLAVNVHTNWGAMVHEVLAVARVDRGHPHTYTARRISEFLRSSSFRVCSEESESYEEAKSQDRKADSLRARMKGYLGVSEFEYRAICEKFVEGAHD